MTDRVTHRCQKVMKNGYRPIARLFGGGGGGGMGGSP